MTLQDLIDRLQALVAAGASPDLPVATIIDEDFVEADDGRSIVNWIRADYKADTSPKLVLRPDHGDIILLGDLGWFTAPYSGMTIYDHEEKCDIRLIAESDGEVNMYGADMEEELLAALAEEVKSDVTTEVETKSSIISPTGDNSLILRPDNFLIEKQTVQSNLRRLSDKWTFEALPDAKDES